MITRFAAVPLVAMALAIACPLSVRAQAVDPFVPEAAATQGVLEARGRRLPYVVEASETLLRDADGRARATVSALSYVAASDAAQRPVTFLFNGGPGGATIALREGLAPRVTAGADRVGAFRFIDNPDSLIDTTDLVFVDAPGTGYGRFFGDGASAAYWGVDEDAAATTDFILQWLAARGREAAPVFLIGESYAGVRVGLIAERLADMAQAPRVAGVILVSPSTLAGRSAPGGDGSVGHDPAVLALPSLAASAHFHGRGAYAALSVDQAAERAWAFATNDYARALAQGEALSDKDQRAIAGALADYTGLSEALIIKQDLRITPAIFTRELLADEGFRIGGSDSRATAPRAITEQRSPPYDDPSTSPYTLTYDQTGAVEALFRTEVGYQPVNGYVRLSIEANRAWNWDRAEGVRRIPDLMGELMARDPALRVTLLAGYYDITIPYARPVQDYLAADLPGDRFDYRVFAAGHAVFSDAEARQAASDHLRDFYEAALTGR